MAKLRAILLMPLLAASLSATVARVEPDMPFVEEAPMVSAFDFAPEDFELEDTARVAPSRSFEQSRRFAQYGVASWYGNSHHGRPTASGARFDMNKLTAAHRSLPLGTAVRVTNLANGRTVDVTINDRGPYIDGRVIDLSRRAASDLAMVESGLAPVRIDLLSAVVDASERGRAHRAFN